MGGRRGTRYNPVATAAAAPSRGPRHRRRSRVGIAGAVLLVAGMLGALGPQLPAMADSVGTVHAATGTSSLDGVACSSATTCVAVGTSSSSEEGVVVPITKGTPGSAVPASATFGLNAVACASATTCVAVGINSSATKPVVVPIAGDAPGIPQVPSTVFTPSAVACASAATCVVVGSTAGGHGGTGGTRAGTGAVLSITNGVLGTTQLVPSSELNGVACSSATTCVAVGVPTTSGGVLTKGVILPIAAGGVPGTLVQVPATTFLGSVACSAATCVAVGRTPGPPDEGAVVPLAVTAATTTTLAPSANPVTTETPVTYTATVSPAPSGGTVASYDNGQPIPTCTDQSISSGTATCTVSYGSTALGAHPITAVYSGDSTDGGSTSLTMTETVITTPGRPTDLRATPGDGQVVLRWGAPLSQGGSAVTGYDVYENGSLVAGPVADTSDTVTGLTDGTSYAFGITALNAAGPGPVASVTATPVADLRGAPTITGAVPGTGSLALTWSAPATTGRSRLVYYVLQAAPTSGRTVTELVALTPTTATLTGLAAGTTYTVTVAAVNAQGEGQASAPVVVATVAAPTEIATATPGYWVASPTGAVTGVGAAPFLGDLGNRALDRPIVGMAATPTGKGYWLVASDGGVFSFGDAAFYGSMGARPLNAPVVGMAATPTGKGYWLVAADGGVFSFGDAAFSGSLGGHPLAAPVVASMFDPTGGYWLVSSAGTAVPFGAPTLPAPAAGLTVAGAALFTR